MRKLFVLLLAGITLNVGAQRAHGQDTARCENCRKAMAHGRKGGKHFEVKPEEREAFKSLCEEYRRECKAVREKYRSGKSGKDTVMTDAEMDARMKNRFACRKAMVTLQEKYYAKFRKVLPPRQAARVLQSGNGHGGHKVFKAWKQGRGECGKPMPRGPKLHRKHNGGRK